MASNRGLKRFKKRTRKDKTVLSVSTLRALAHKRVFKKKRRIKNANQSSNKNLAIIADTSNSVWIQYGNHNRIEEIVQDKQFNMNTMIIACRRW